MNDFQRTKALIREACLSAFSQPIASLLTIVMVAGMVIAALLTTGQTAAAERAAMGQIDAAGTRSIVIRASEHAGLTPALVGQLRSLAGIEALTAFGPITDVRNAAVPGATWVGMRTVYGDFDGLAEPGSASASLTAAHLLGLVDGTGGVMDNANIETAVVGSIAVPEHLQFLDPLVVVAPQPESADNYLGNGYEPGTQLVTPITMMVILAREPRYVAALTTAITGMLDITDPQQVTIETSAQLATLRDAVSGELGTHGRATVLGIIGVGGLLVAVNMFGLVQMRRRDFGRRRALGASQALIVALLLSQTAILAVIGAVIGIVIALTIMLRLNNPIPGIDFILALGVAGILISLIGSIIPAIVASRRDPLHELRIA